MSTTKTAAKKKAATKTAEPVRVKVRVLVSGEYDTGSTTFTLAKGVVVSLPKANAERHAEAGKVAIL